jgi:cytochrome oxidase Cu insertion factor (SCO1/SenC/PrrC family)
VNELPAGVADESKLAFVTTDSARDSSALLRRWLALFDQRFGLTGSVRAIQAVQRTLAIAAATKAGRSNTDYAVSRANFVLVLTPRTISPM